MANKGPGKPGRINKVAGLKEFLSYENDLMSFSTGQNGVRTNNEVTVLTGGREAQFQLCANFDYSVIHGNPSLLSYNW